MVNDEHMQNEICVFGMKRKKKINKKSRDDKMARVQVLPGIEKKWFAGNVEKIFF